MREGVNDTSFAEDRVSPKYLAWSEDSWYAAWVTGLRKFTRNRAAAAGAVVVLALVVLAVFAPFIAPYDPIKISPAQTLQPPNGSHWFGTDDLGRDVLSRVIWGARVSLRVGLGTALISTTIGLLFGLIGGYFGGGVGFVILRLMDLLLAFPGILLALVIIAMLGPGLTNVMIAVGVSAGPTFTRVIYGAVLEAKTYDYVDAARGMGASSTRVLLRHVLPNVMAPTIVMFTMQVGAAIFAASSLSFIGLGAQPPTPEWGAMVSRGRYMLRDAMWMSTFPGLAIAVSVIAVNVVGDGLRDLLDPRTRFE